MVPGSWRTSAAYAERRLHIRGLAPPEPRRPRLADIERMCAELPYGFWKDATGRIVIFNRRYRPLWQRLADGTIDRADPGEWVPWVKQSWFDFTDVRYEKSARDRLRKILQDFFAGKDLTPYTTGQEFNLADGPQRRKAARP